MYSVPEPDMHPWLTRSGRIRAYRIEEQGEKQKMNSTIDKPRVALMKPTFDQLIQ
jgi:hypothetical protein